MSSTIDQDSTPLAPRAGADLRMARERVGWSLPDMASGLRIRQQYLEALEDGRLAALPGNAYALGFMRTYATALGLDPNEIARRFKAEAAAVNRKTELAFPVPVPGRGVPAGAVVLLGVVLAIGAYVGWYRLSGEGRLPAETNTQIPTRLAPLAQQAVPPTVTGAAFLAAKTPAAALPAQAVQQAEMDAPPVPVVSPSSAAAAQMPAPAAASAVAAVVPPAMAATADQARIVLRASADAWVQVRDRAGPVLLNRTLHPGESWEVPAKPNLVMTTGNAGGTDLVVDGVTMPSLGASGAVRRDLPLDPDLIKDGKLAAANTPATLIRPPAQ